MVVGLAVATSLWAASGSSRAQSSDTVLAKVSDLIVAKVDDIVIDGRDYALAQQMFVHDLKGLDEKARHDFLVQYLIDVALMSRDAQKRDLKVDEAALQRNFDFIRKKALMESWLGTVGQGAISEDSVRAAYEQAVKDTSEPQIRMRTMLFKVDAAGDEKAVKTAEERANEAVARVKKGEEFTKVAEDMTGTSLPATLKEAGYQSRQQMKPEIAKVAFTTDVGSTTAPIRTEQGWEVVKVEDKQTRKPLDFDIVKSQFAMVVARKAQLAAMEKLRSEAKIERMDIPEPPQDQAAKTPNDAAKAKTSN
ncbi:peptidylprolyl isomerase [Bradyrhizobium commune]|uniref:Parvulin-like PPIase n=1 Tax=Bradyrhizobium commune TaxID=83627 RepID=A0A7S9H295_9BRAD|nr:peptidylprolyl isomerase [Bradyrhizobium commune]QPF94559.1 peptidyl-prolyl cis-trans isomerase [Bradyrhizobium commune]